MKIIHVVGARPNFMKIAPLMEAFDKYNISTNKTVTVEQYLVHTGQHYDREMSALFFDELEMPEPDINLQIGPGLHGEQTGRIMQAFEKVLLVEKPDLVIVAGDVNSTMACAIDAKKLDIPVAHVEAGLRSFDRTMPEELNRIITDSISDILLTTDLLANRNLLKEGIEEENIHFVGNIMIDTLLKHKEKALNTTIMEDLKLREDGNTISYAVLTMHRPSNVDASNILKDIGEALIELGQMMPVIFPVHPRTSSKINDFGLDNIFNESNNIRLYKPFGYLEFLNLMSNSDLILTDSGGIQEESTILGIPCLTLRSNTERPITIEKGTNKLVGNDKDVISNAISEYKLNRKNNLKQPDLWDGSAGERIVEVITGWYENKNN